MIGAYTSDLQVIQPVAAVAAYVNQTAEHESYYRTFLLAAGVLCGLTALSFGLPALAWYRRTKEKQQADRSPLFTSGSSYE